MYNHNKSISYDICKQSVNQLIDASASDEKLKTIRRKIINTKGVIKIDNL
ncbi:hypothetical protein [Clostridium butyricum]